MFSPLCLLLVQPPINYIHKKEFIRRREFPKKFYKFVLMFIKFTPRRGNNVKVYIRFKLG